jgi:hypothetical protein
LVSTRELKNIILTSILFYYYYQAKINEAGIQAVRVKGTPAVNTDANGRVWVNFKYKFESISYTDADWSKVKGKIVVLALTAEGLANTVATPVGILNTLTETSNVQMQITFNQIARFSDRNLKYFTRNQIWDTHSGSGSSNGLPGEVGLDNIGVYSFSLKPEEHQPSGTCNFSRITNPRLVFSNFDLAAGEKINSLDIFAVSYNIFRIMSGMGNIAYAY